MFCTKCGHKVENGTSFCGYCGADLTQEASVPRQGEQQAPAANEPVPQQKAEQSPVQQAPIEKKRPNGTVLLVMGLAAAAVIGGVLAFNAYNSPAAQMNRALSGDQLELAYEIFDENFYPEDLSPKSMELLSAAAARVQENYAAGTVSYYREGITEETAPINLELDVTGKTTMRVVTDNSGTYSYGYLYFTNTNFAKAETQQS